MEFALHNSDGTVMMELASMGPGRLYRRPAIIATWQGFNPPNEGCTCVLIGRFGSREEYRREGNKLIQTRVLDSGDVCTFRC